MCYSLFINNTEIEMKVYITKYALTKGIYVVEGEISQHNDMFCQNADYPQYFHKPDWHEDWDDALKQASLMKDKKIKSIKKQLSKLENLEFHKP